MTDIALDEKAARAAYEAFGEGEYGFGPFADLPVEAKQRWQKVAGAVRASPSQVAPQPEAGEAVTMQYRYRHRNPKAIWSEWGDHKAALSSYSDWEEEGRPLYASPQPANPAQVTDAMVNAVLTWVCDDVLPAYDIPSDVPRNDPELPDSCRAALIAAIGAGGQAVAVKPLEWKPGGGDGKMSIRADAIGLRYYIYLNGDDGLWHAYTEGYQMENFGEHPTKELAQKAVQTGHERRILSALSQPHPADERVVEALTQMADVSEHYDGMGLLQYRPRMSAEAMQSLAFRTLAALSATEGRS